MSVRAGTSGFSYDEWRDSFYPSELPKDEMLGYYAGRFDAVEINNTWYRMPSARVLERWADQVPNTFRFALKANRQITHFKRLKPEAIEPMEYFWAQAKTLGPRLGPILIQLPPNFKKDLPRLTDFLDAVPDGLRAALEFRHDTWHDEEVFTALSDRGAALVIAQMEETETPRVATADWGYLRLRKVEYEPGEVAGWAAWVGERDWEEAYVFFKHESEGTGPRLAQRFLEAAAG